MNSPLDALALDQLFRTARSLHKFTAREVDDATVRELYDLVKVGPTGFNAQPARYVFVRSAQARAKLGEGMSSSNRPKTLAAPLSVIIAYDTQFHEQLPTQFTRYDAKSYFDGATPDAREAQAKFNATLQAAYLLLGARALGLDAGPMSGFKGDVIDAAFFPDGRYKTLLVMNLGYADRTEAVPPPMPRLSFEQVAVIV